LLLASFTDPVGLLAGKGISVLPIDVSLVRCWLPDPNIDDCPVLDIGRNCCCCDTVEDCIGGNCIVALPPGPFAGGGMIGWDDCDWFCWKDGCIEEEEEEKEPARVAFISFEGIITCCWEVGVAVDSIRLLSAIPFIIELLFGFDRTFMLEPTAEEFRF